MNTQVTNTNKFADVPIRVRSWGIIIIILSIGLLHPLLTLLFVGSMSARALHEYFRIIDLKTNSLSYLCYPAVLLLLSTGYLNNYKLFVVSIPLYAIILSAITHLRYKNRLLSKNILTGIILCTFPIGHLLFIRYFNIETNPWFGIKVVLFILVTTQLNDVFQYLSGKLFGKKQIVPKISPNKTQEGLLGGILLSIILANSLGPFLLTGYNIIQYTFLGLIISTLGFAGDVYLSSIKRDAGVKDFGSLIPGHGGLLDRIDSLTFVLPVCYILLNTLL